MNRRYDYDMLEREYVTTDVSLRELCRRHGISSHSLITVQSRKREWVRKRQEYRLRAADQTVVFMADKEADMRAKEAMVRANAIEAIDEAIMKLRADMKRTHTILRDGEYVEEPVMILRPHDIAMLIDRLQVLVGRPSQITEERNIGVNFDGVSPELLMGFIEATRDLGSLDGSDQDSPIPRSGRSRKN